MSWSFGIWTVEGALVVAILFVVVSSLDRIRGLLTASLGSALGGAMLATLNTVSEYGFGAVIAILPGFRVVSSFLAERIHNSLVSAAITTNVLAGIAGSASGGLSIAPATMGQTLLQRSLGAVWVY